MENTVSYRSFGLLLLLVGRISLKGERKQKITASRMTGNSGSQLARSEQDNFNEKSTKDHEKSKEAMKEKERTMYHWDLDVQPLISSAKWLQLHGLKKNKLTLSQILSQIGFEHKQGYVSILRKLVASRYTNDLYRQYRKISDGKVYNLTAKKSHLLHFENCLTGIIALCKQRMEWLTTESRQIFGVIQEQNITIVLDFGTTPSYEFELCREALRMVLTQQVAQIVKFNLVRVAQDIMKWQEKAVFVTKDTIEAAINWLWTIKYMPAVCPTGPTEAILAALLDHTTEAVYYFVVGDIPECMKNLLLQKISSSPQPVHTVSFNAREEETVAFLKELNHLTTGRFHAFAERTDDVNMMGISLNNEDEKTTRVSRKLKGRQPLETETQQDGNEALSCEIREVYAHFLPSL